MTSMLAAYVGLGVGRAIAALSSTPPAGDVRRVAALRPHSLGAYLPRGSLIFQVVSAGIGLLAVATALGGLAPDGYAAVLLYTGVAVVCVSATVYALQRRLLVVPRLAATPGEVVTNDVVLAIGLWDIASLPALSVYCSAASIALSLDVPLWVPVIAMAALFLMMWKLPIDEHPKLPVARAYAPRRVEVVA